MTYGLMTYRGARAAASAPQQQLWMIGWAWLTFGSRSINFYVPDNSSEKRTLSFSRERILDQLRWNARGMALSPATRPIVLRDNWYSGWQPIRRTTAILGDDLFYYRGKFRNLWRPSDRIAADGRRPGVWEFSIGGVGPATLSKQSTVFVVDDDPAMLRSVERLLSAHGYDSVLFPSADAFQKHDNFEQAICVVLDINLGDDSGIKVGHRLKVAGVSLPVIFITGSDSPATRMAAMASGCLAYLTKPFAAKSLMEPIGRIAAGLV